MPTVRVRLEEHEIRDELKKRGYGFHLDRRYPIWLTSADSKAPRRQSGTPQRVQHVPIQRPIWERILEYADTVKEAADQVVLLSHGKLTDPVLSGEHQKAGGSGAVDPELIRSLVEAQVANALAEKDKQRDGENATLREENESLRSKVEALLARDKQKKAKGKPAPAKPAAPAPGGEPQA